MECSCHGAHPRPGADEEKSPLRRARDAESPRNPSSRQSIDDDRPGDDEERQRYERIGSLDPRFAQTQCEHGGDRRGDDPARRHAHQHHTLTPRESRAHGRRQYAGRPYDQNENREQG